MSNLTVLIVDDAYFMRNLLKKHLKEAGYEVVGEAKNGKEGIKLYFELKPDFVTMDINMPDISGIEVTKEILSKDKNAKIIAVTGNNQEDIKQQIMEVGAKEYLQKPFQPAFLWSKIEKMFAEPEVIEEDIPVPLVQDTTVIAQEEGIEDDFDNMEIELMDKPDESKSATLVIQNNEDDISFPEEYEEQVEEQKDTFMLTKEKVEAEVDEEDDLLIELDDNTSLTPSNIPSTVQKQSIPEPQNTQSTPVQPPKKQKETVISPTIGHKVPKSPVQPKIEYQVSTSHPTHSKEPKEIETFVSTVEITKSKKSDRKIEEINIRPQGMSPSVNIRPPRGRVLREETHDKFDNVEIEEPILNVSEKDHYNDKNDSLLSIVKKLFKK